MNSPVTNRDVAEATGVSTTVVSWVLNGRAEQNRVSAETQRRVKAAISQLGYVPSQVARSLSPAGKGGLLSGTSNLTNVLSAAGYHLVSVANVEDLRRLTAEGLVGVLYRRPSTIDHRPETLPVEPQAPLQAPVDADVPAQSIVEGPAASVTRIDPPGTNAAETVRLSSPQASASTFEAEPERVSLPEPIPLAQEPSPVPTSAPISELPVIEDAAQVPETPHLNPLPQGERKDGNQEPQTSPIESQAPLQAPVDADVPAQSIVEGPAASVTRIDPPGTNAAGTSASTFEAEPELESLQSPLELRPQTLPVESQAPLQAPVDADVPALSFVEGPAASVTRIDPPGTNAAGTSASTLEPEPASQPPPGIEATPTPPPAPVVVPPPIPTPAPAPTPPIVEVAPAVFISESGSDEPSAMGGQASTSEKTEAPPMATPNDNTENNNA